MFASLFFTSVVHHEVLSCGRTVNKIMCRLHEAIHRKQPRWGNITRGNCLFLRFKRTIKERRFVNYTKRNTRNIVLCSRKLKNVKLMPHVTTVITEPKNIVLKTISSSYSRSYSFDRFLRAKISSISKFSKRIQLGTLLIKVTSDNKFVSFVSFFLYFFFPDSWFFP